MMGQSFLYAGDTVGLRTEVANTHVFFVGIKGTGMASLACVLSRFGALVSGSDVPETFRTDVQLQGEGICWTERFDADALPIDTDMVIYSAAYDDTSHPQIIEAKRRGIRCFSYPAYLAHISRLCDCYGIAGTHGKTTTGSCLDTMFKEVQFPSFSLYGSYIPKERRENTCLSDTIGIIEACEYRRHFLLYTLQGVLITAIEHDHPDWYADEQAVYEAFQDLAKTVPLGGFLLCCNDWPLSRRLALWAQSSLPGRSIITYGRSADSTFRLSQYSYDGKESSCILSPFTETFHVPLPGVAFCLDVIAAALLGACIMVRASDRPLHADQLIASGYVSLLLDKARLFNGCAGRLEEVACTDGVSFIDDYSHHPSQVSAALESLRIAYPKRRLVVIFTPHTQSRTETFFVQFAQALSEADVLFVRPVYASARKDGDARQSLFLSEKLAKMAGGACINDEDTLIASVGDLLREGDLCITMGAGNSYGMASRIIEYKRSKRSW